MLILGSPGFPGRDYLCSGQAVKDSEWQRKGLSPLAGDANRQKRGSSGSPQVWTAGWLCLSLCGNLAMRVYFPLPGGLRNAGIMNFDKQFFLSQASRGESLGGHILHSPLQDAFCK